MSFVNTDAGNVAFLPVYGTQWAGYNFYKVNNSLCFLTKMIFHQTVWVSNLPKFIKIGYVIEYIICDWL